MPKVKLTSAVKPSAASGSTALPAADPQAGNVAPVTQPAATGNGGDAPRSGTAGEADPEDSIDDEDDAAPSGTSGDDKPDQGAGGKTAETKASSEPKSLADFRSAFGHEQGSIFYADQVSYTDACTTHMATQLATITSQAAEIAELKKTSTAYAAQLKGETEPLLTGPKGSGASQGGDSVSEFAASAEQRMAAKSGKS